MNKTVWMATVYGVAELITTEHTHTHKDNIIDNMYNIETIIKNNLANKYLYMFVLNGLLKHNHKL